MGLPDGWWQRAAIVIITPPMANPVERRRCLDRDFGEALLAGEIGGNAVGFTPWSMISDAKKSRRRRRRNR